MKRFLLIFILWQTISAIAEDGSRLWLRYPDTLAQPASISYISEKKTVGNEATEAIVKTAMDELCHHWQGLPITLCLRNNEKLEPDAFRIIKIEEESFRISASSATGLLYGAYFALRAQTMGDGCLCQALGPSHDLTERPSAAIRSISIEDPTLLLQRCITFARAMASIGVNEVIIPPKYLNKVESLADTLLPFGIAIKFSESTKPTLPLTSDNNWTKDHLLQYEWYFVGRRLWQPDLSPERIVCEWLAQTFNENPFFIISMRDAMLSDKKVRVSRIFDTWQEMHSYVDSQRYEEVETTILQQLTDEK
jgi:alpha-glucuronidase